MFIHTWGPVVLRIHTHHITQPRASGSFLWHFPSKRALCSPCCQMSAFDTTDVYNPPVAGDGNLAPVRGEHDDGRQPCCLGVTSTSRAQLDFSVCCCCSTQEPWSEKYVQRIEPSMCAHTRAPLLFSIISLSCFSYLSHVSHISHVSHVSHVVPQDDQTSDQLAQTMVPYQLSSQTTQATAPVSVRHSVDSHPYLSSISLHVSHASLSHVSPISLSAEV